jgi:small subunit ribosomal protein S3
MGHKVNPLVFRGSCLHVGFFSEKEFFPYCLIINDIKDFFGSYAEEYLISDNVIVKFSQNKQEVKITISCVRVNQFIGEKGVNIVRIQKELKKKISKTATMLGLPSPIEPEIGVKEEKRIYSDPSLVTLEIRNNIINRRMSHNKAVNMVLERMKAAGVVDYKITLKGRINGAEIASKKDFSQGRLPLSTISENIGEHNRSITTKTGLLSAKASILINK